MVFTRLQCTFFSRLFVCVCIVCTCVCSCVHACRGQRKTLGILFNPFLSQGFLQSLLLCLELGQQPVSHRNALASAYDRSVVTGTSVWWNLEQHRPSLLQSKHSQLLSPYCGFFFPFKTLNPFWKMQSMKCYINTQFICPLNDRCVVKFLGHVLLGLLVHVLKLWKTENEFKGLFQQNTIKYWLCLKLIKHFYKYIVIEDLVLNGKSYS